MDEFIWRIIGGIGILAFFVGFTLYRHSADLEREKRLDAENSRARKV